MARRPPWWWRSAKPWWLAAVIVGIMVLVVGLFTGVQAELENRAPGLTAHRAAERR